jgi:energy-coupling factor transporter ATP-binding protein EcfA2
MHQPSQDCVAIYDAIKALPDNLDLSDPTTFTELPFPSLLPIPTQRFERIMHEGSYYFEYMGRSKFRELQDFIKQPNFLAGCDRLYLYGTSGSGKSHLLAALACHLIREGKRVVYIPDCRDLLKRPGAVIWTALRLAFYDSASLNDIQNTNDAEELIDFMFGHKDDLYIIVDQLNALEVADNNASNARKAEQAEQAVQAMMFGHRFIFSASANEATSREADGKQTGNSVLQIFGGMSEVHQYLHVIPCSTHTPIGGNQAMVYPPQPENSAVVS